MLLPACSAVRSSTESNRLQLSNRYQRDSIYLHDSVSVTFHPVLSPSPCGEGRGGVFDTLCIERWHTRWRDRETVKTDTITLTETKTETVEKPYVPSFYKYCAAFAILFALYWLVKRALYIAKRYYLH